MSISPAKWYTRVVGLFFVLVALSLAVDLVKFGFRPETMHKIFHVLLGIAVIRWGWNNHRWWKKFPIINGAFFCGVGLFGWLFPDFGGLDAFNRLDTILHSTVGVMGLVVWFFDRQLQAKAVISR
ncbi:MAG: hypothetical protein Q8Q39_06000 [bacterium]|nr:hypothetical protein [bacterium]